MAHQKGAAPGETMVEEKPEVSEEGTRAAGALVWVVEGWVGLAPRTADPQLG